MCPALLLSGQNSANQLNLRGENSNDHFNSLCSKAEMKQGGYPGIEFKKICVQSVLT